MLCVDCTGIGMEHDNEPRCGWHQQDHDERARSEALAELQDHLNDNLATELWARPMENDMSDHNIGSNNDQWVECRNYLDSRGYSIRAVASRTDGYVFYLVQKHDINGGKPVVFAGCRKGYTLAQYRRHVRISCTYGGRTNRKKIKETLAILDLFKIVANKLAA